MHEKNVIYIVGIGPGREDMMTVQAIHTLERSDVIVGYVSYIRLLSERFKNKEKLSTPMTEEEERCRMAFREAEKGKTVSVICSGDAGIYGLASLMYELLPEYPDCELSVIPGVTAAVSGAAHIGAPLNHDFCVISLSDRLTAWGQIEKRLIAAADGDFAIALYNPASNKRVDYLERACDILLKRIEETRVCGYVENIGRECTKIEVCSLSQLKHKPVNMSTTVFIGNSQSVVIDEKLVTKRGYKL